MFSKTSDPTSAPPVPRPSAPGTNSARSVLGADLRITGEITSSGSVEVLGEIEGNITANGLIIGQEGQVKGSITAHTVEVKGKFDGKVSCESFTLRASSEVKADVNAAALVIESGARIEGRFTKPKA
ncbi:MAG: polymer-forming cytoskeletal protein [Tabrizicola sp.]|uniref:bactofilin family protein n=1 Tax=Tabrizicola sp. TaxID=2005166 RepID=UPI002ABC4B44|nr:polymer-forming cytoskeletal protein [Tabrizicola sp.]MDZ4088027.1 polymer-forming cytoskeletal protein [Tabrizicola sp.]